METYEHNEIRKNIHQMIIRDECNGILAIFEREDHSDDRTAIIGLFGATCHSKDINNKEIDRFLFL